MVMFPVANWQGSASTGTPLQHNLPIRTRLGRCRTSGEQSLAEWRAIIGRPAHPLPVGYRSSHCRGGNGRVGQPHRTFEYTPPLHPWPPSRYPEAILLLLTLSFITYHRAGSSTSPKNTDRGLTGQTDCLSGRLWWAPTQQVVGHTQKCGL